MTTRTWREVEPVLEQAATLDGGDLEQYLAPLPETFRSQVLVLLGDSPEYGLWAAEAVARIIEIQPRLAVPSDLGPYRVIRHVATGGMGEVYEAEDPRLKRKVAIKVLHAGAVRRLDDEAQALARLRHPNICRVYDVGRAGSIEYFVMELLDGVPLVERLKNGPLPLDEALAIGRAVAGALAEAHRLGIVHRDVKPANIVLTRNGPSLVDFGIAGLSMAESGILAGTPPYMAPEQAHGSSDPRSDIYSLGAVLREMTGDSAPAPVRSIIAACLREDAGERWQSAADLARALEWLAQPVGVRAAVPWWRRWWWAGYLAAGLAAGAVWLGTGLWREKAPGPLLAPLPAPRNHAIRDPRHLAVSPDSTRVAFIAPGEAEEPLVWVRNLSEITAEPLAATFGATLVFWSPDGQSIGLFRGRKLDTLHLASGQLRQLGEAVGPVQQAVWGEDGAIVYSVWNIQGDGVIYRIPAAGGTPQRITAIDRSQEEVSHGSPVLLPGGERFLFVADSNPVTYNPTGPGTTYMASVKGDMSRTLLFRGVSPVGMAGGRLYYQREDKLWSRRLNPHTGQWLDQERLEVAGAAWAQVTREGVITYMPPGGKGRAAWVDRQGRKLSDVPIPEGSMAAVAMSPGGTALVTGRDDQSGAFGLWIVRDGRAERIASEFGRYLNPVWSADSRWIHFASFAAGIFRRRPVAGAGEELLLPRNRENKVVNSTTRDGRWGYMVTYDASNGRGFDIYRLDLRNRTRHPWSVTEKNETQPRLSPDERWMAWLCEYARDAGRLCVSPRDEPLKITYVTAIPSNEPEWSRDGRQLYFTSGGWLHAVRLSFQADHITASAPERLFELCANVYLGRRYAVDTDNRFLVRDMLRPVPDPVLVWNPGRK